ncbi:MAG: hypothetical protein JSS49_17605 [Planctomycetes bacterium]|nr:hypothetical protein [Planctomycetota bacterium]
MSGVNLIRRIRTIRPASGRSHQMAMRSPNSAFTLLEVVLALTLAVFLLGAIFTAMDQSWKLTASGREEMERSQLARALLRKISLDIRSIAYVAPETTDDSSATGSTGSTTGVSSSSSSSSTTTSTDATSTEPSPTSIGIRGNMQRVEMHISRARRDLEFSAQVDGNKLQSHTSDLRAVTYQLAIAGSGSPVTGLIRTEGDRLAVQQVEEKGGTAATMSGQQALSPEVNYLEFRYFDGRAWYTTWDSEESARLPRAVEVIIGFAPSHTRLGPALRVAVSGSTNRFRTVVLIPIADPLPEEFVQ